ncbi:hypothetical protein SAMN04487770_12366 [Butyrivibrio sp. ob235]|uniref:hypothetical protein n=1 Tax=Butyrivibrio sp. ob235 TaxID=1761780 RepID=UPI0008BA9F7E|nr:hypothetical protein [Butyrivibrio sp. ob235]SEM01935.1 hypothetical protein SAMN04487770_12366 [Butyrivibrio sp. ob235]
MEEKYYFDNTLFSTEDYKEAAKDLLDKSINDFESIKNRKWYEKFFSAINVGNGDKKIIISQIKNIEDFFKLFLAVYDQDLKLQDDQLDRIVSELLENRKDVEKIYELTVLGINRENDIRELLDDRSKYILLLILSKASSFYESCSKLSDYNKCLADYLLIDFVQVELTDSQLEELRHPEIVYRCLAEQKAICGVDDFPQGVLDIIDGLAVSEKSKRKIEEQVSEESRSFSPDYFISKYAKRIIIETKTSANENINDENEIDKINEPVPIIEKQIIEKLLSCKANYIKPTEENAQNFFSMFTSYGGKYSYGLLYKTYETSGYVIYFIKGEICIFSKRTGESKEFDIKKLLNDYYKLSEATSDDIICDHTREVFESINVHGDGFFFSIGPKIFYSVINENACSHDTFIDLSSVWDNENPILIKGVESNYFIFSYEKNRWCLLNLSSGEILKPEHLQKRTNNFVISGDYAYYMNADVSEYKKNKSNSQYQEKTSSIQIFQCDLISGKEHAATQKIYPHLGQEDGLGKLVSFIKINDKYIALRRTHFVSNNSASFAGLLLGTVRISYLYMIFDSQFNPIDGDYFKSIDDEITFAEYIDNGIVIYDNTDIHKVRLVSLFTGKSITIGTGNISDVIRCGNYLALINSNAIIPINMDEYTQ